MHSCKKWILVDSSIYLRFHIFSFWWNNLYVRIWNSHGLSTFSHYSRFIVAKFGDENFTEYCFSYFILLQIREWFYYVCSRILKGLYSFFNFFPSKIQFTMEIGKKKLNFLDITPINNNIIKFDHKSTFLDRYLNFLSHHPLSQKRDTIIGLVDQIFFFCHILNSTQKTLRLWLIFYLTMIIHWILFLVPFTIIWNIY